MKKIATLFLLLTTVLTIPVLVYADKASGGNTTTVTQPTPLDNPIGGVTSIAGLFYKVAQYVFDLSYVVIAVFLILSGFKFVTAQGSEDKLVSAKKTFWYTIIGALIIVGANTIIGVVQSIINGLK